VLYEAISNGDESEQTVGVLTYYIPAIGNTLAVMWYDMQLKPNRWNIRLYDGERKIDNHMYFELCRDAIKTSDYQPTLLGSGLKAFGSISSIRDSQITLEIHVETVM